MYPFGVDYDCALTHLGHGAYLHTWRISLLKEMKLCSKEKIDSNRAALVFSFEEVKDVRLR
jgi:hypothetical protein